MKTRPMSLLPLNPFSIKKQPVKKNEDEVQESCTPNQRCYLSWCVCLWLSLTIYLLVSFILELVGSSVAKRTAFELLLSAQQKGDICLPVADGEEGSWTQVDNAKAPSVSL